MRVRRIRVPHIISTLTEPPCLRHWKTSAPEFTLVISAGIKFSGSVHAALEPDKYGKAVEVAKLTLTRPNSEMLYSG